MTQEQNSLLGVLKRRISKSTLRQVEDSNSIAPGVANTFLNESSAIYNSTDGELVLGPDANRRIVFGRDRVSHPMSGEGGLGSDRCASIDIVAGAIPKYNIPYLREAVELSLDTPDGETLSSLKIDPNIMYDAARIKITQKSNVDIDYGLVGSEIIDQPRSFVVGSADGVRLLARDAGIRLITGYSPENSRGLKRENTAKRGIELIAMNDIQSSGMQLESMVKGESLLEVIFDLYSLISNVTGALEEFRTHQNTFNTIVSLHTHLVTAPTLPSTPSIETTLSGMQEQIRFVFDSINSIQTRFQTVNDQLKLRLGKKMLSKYNKVN